jgi:hypothetical protein
MMMIYDFLLSQTLHDSTGSIYQLANHQTTPGDMTPVAIALAGFPTGMFLFYAAITKAMVETEEDDKKFLSGR